MYTIDSNGNVTLPRGDTLPMPITIRGVNYPEGTVGVFGIRAKSGSGARAQVLRKAFPVAAIPTEPEAAKISVYLSNGDTRGINPGVYLWDLRIVTDPEYDAEGNVCCNDEGDNVMSIFAGRVKGMPTFTVVEVAADV